MKIKIGQVVRAQGISIFDPSMKKPYLNIIYLNNYLIFEST